MTLAQVEDEFRKKRGEEKLELANPPELRWGLFTLKASLFQPLISEASPFLLRSHWSANTFPSWACIYRVRPLHLKVTSMLAAPQGFIRTTHKFQMDCGI
jgi:hypothetical protein